jgi:hypothetical protein
MRHSTQGGHTRFHDYFVDWSPTRGVAYARDDEDPQWFVSAQARYALCNFIASIPHGSTVYLETNFEAHDPQLHNAVIELAATLEVKLCTLPIRVTGDIKKSLEFGSGRKVNDQTTPEIQARTKHRALTGRGVLAADELPLDDDLLAVIAIRQAVCEGQHCARPKRWDRELTLAQMFQAHRTGHLLTRHSEWVRALTATVPHLRTLADQDPEVAVFLGTPPKTTTGDHLGGYSLELLCAAAIAARETKSRPEFDRAMGLYAHGYPSNFRSSYCRRVDTLVRREHGKSADLFFRSDLAVRESVLHWRRVGRRAARTIRRLTLGTRDSSVEGILHSSVRLERGGGPSLPLAQGTRNSTPTT